MPLHRLLVNSIVLMFVLATASAFAADKPNILWLSCEDISPHLRCYGYPLADTPHLDAFADEGTKFTHAFATAGVCAPCRSAIITGMYQTSLGTQHMRCDATLPPHIKPFTHWLREAGYYCTNNSKTDYQFKVPKGTWDESSGNAHWKNRPKADQPFFAVFNYTGCHESGIESESKYKTVTKGLKPHDRNALAADLPPYYPDTPEVREDWGRYYDVITAMDRWFGEQLQELEDAELADNTIVIFWSDHGVGLPRAKRWLYDSGMRVPLIVRIPEKFRTNTHGTPGTTSSQLISLIDLGPTVLNLAGVTLPEHMHGQPFLGPNCPEPREYVFGCRDRMDERYDTIRAVRDHKFKYIRNYEPFKTYYQYMNTPEQGATMQAIREAERRGTPAPRVQQFLVDHKPVEELYDTEADPHELRNLADNPEYRQVLDRLREQHLKWTTDTLDLGLIPEAEINARAEKVGTPWDILNSRTDSAEYMQRLRDAASISLKGREAISEMHELLKDSDAAIRYWGAVGLGNIGVEAVSASDDLRLLLEDSSEDARIAAARALCRMNLTEAALPVLVDVLDNGTQWARLRAANVLDEMDEQTRPVIEVLRRNKAPRKDLVADGKYTVRVLNRALNELQGTNETVP